MSNKKDNKYSEQIQEISVHELLNDEENDIIEISINDSYKEEEYPSIYNHPKGSFIRDNGLQEKTGIKRSSFNLDEDQIVSYQNSKDYSLSNQSFSGLNASYNQFDINNSKLKVIQEESQDYRGNNVNTIINPIQQKIPYKQQQPQYDPKYIQNFNQSIFTQRVNNHNFAAKNKSQSPQEQYKNYQKSVYMNSAQPELSPKKIQKIQPPKQRLIKVIYRPTNYYIQRQSDKYVKSIIVDDICLKNLYDQFFKKQIFIPLFKQGLYDQWNNSKDKNDQDSQIHKIFKINIERYILYINQKYQKEFNAIFDVLLELQNSNMKRKTQNVSAFSFFSLGNLMENLKQYINTSKTENLRKALISKMRAYDQAIKYCQQNAQFKGSLDNLTKCIEKVWCQLKEIYLLLSFQQTQNYCSKKIQNSPQAKFKQIWIKYRQVIKKQRYIHISKNLKEITI